MPLVPSRSAAATSAHRFEWSTQAFSCACECVLQAKMKIIMFFSSFSMAVIGMLYYFTFLSVESFVCARCASVCFVRAHLFPVNIINVVVILPITLDTCFAFLMNKRPGTITLIQTTNFSISFSFATHTAYSMCFGFCGCVFFARSFSKWISTWHCWRAECNLLV